MLSLVRRRNSGVRHHTYDRWLEPFGLLDSLARWDNYEVGNWYTPALEAKETTDSYLFSLDLPGIEEKDLDISMKEGTLTISGKREHEKVSDEESYYACERCYGSFSRSFTLPNTADADSVSAELKNGVLTVSVGKKPEAQPKQITVKAS